MIMFLINVYFLPGFLALAGLSFIRNYYQPKLSFRFGHAYATVSRQAAGRTARLPGALSLLSGSRNPGRGLKKPGPADRA